MPPFVHPPRPIPRPQQALIVDPVVQSTAPAAVMPATSSNFLGVGNGFTGPSGSFSVQGAPSDANMAAGPNHIVQAVNSSYAVFSKTGTVIAGPTTFATRFSNFGGCQNTYYSDPIVQYDRQADRWILSILAYASANSGPYYHCIAVSTTGDPTGSYARYAYSFSNLPDYPKMGVWPDAYYVTYNMFQGNTLLGAQVCAHNRTAMLAGQPETSQCFMTGSSDGALLPADVDGASAPPNGAPNYLLSLASVANTLSLWTLHVDWSTPANSTFTGPINIGVAPFNLACSNGGTCIPQSGTSTQLDSLGDRLMYRLAYRNFGDHEALVANHSVNPGSETGVRWYEIRSPGSNPSVYQQGTYAPDSNHRWMGSIGMDSAGDIGLGVSVSGSSIHPEVHYTGSLASDLPLGNMTQGEASIIDGAGSQTTYFCFPFTCALTRWGDYTAIRIDPSDDCTFWYTNQYIPSNGAFNWSTRIASFKFPSCGGTVTVPAAPTNLSATGGNAQVSLTWTGSSGATSYNVKRGTTSGGPYTTVGSPATTGYTDTGLTNGTTYYYVVTAVNSGGESGNSSQASATPQAPPPAPSFTLSAPAFSVRHGSSAPDTITITPANGFTGNVQLSASNLPPRSTASFSPNPVAVSSTSSSTMTLTTSSSTKRKTYTITITGTGGGTTASTTVNVTVN